MTIALWGLLGPETLPSTRRTRTLGVAPSVRFFNDRAVPGLGGVWFAKPVLLSLLGIHVAERSGQRNIEVANAIEALGCWLAIHGLNEAQDPRVRGARKLRADADLRYRSVRRPSFYVTQPMRMATVQLLPALGLVDAQGSRFSAFRCSAVGKELLDAAFDACKPSNRNLPDHLLQWVRDEEVSLRTPAMQEALAPTVPLPTEARRFFTERLRRGGEQEPTGDRDRRRDALDWVDAIRQGRSKTVHWSKKPGEIRSDSHWSDLHAGACFFQLRDSALSLLDLIEVHFGSERRLELTGHIVDQCSAMLTTLRGAAKNYLDLGHPDALARAFANDCAQDDSRSVIRALVRRDGVVLKLIGGDIGCGPAFTGGTLVPSDEDVDATVANEPTQPGWPPGISFRVGNLYRLNLDLHGELTGRLTGNVGTEVTP